VYKICLLFLEIFSILTPKGDKRMTGCVRERNTADNNSYSTIAEKEPRSTNSMSTATLLLTTNMLSETFYVIPVTVTIIITVTSVFGITLFIISLIYCKTKGHKSRHLYCNINELSNDRSPEQSIPQSYPGYAMEKGKKISHTIFETNNGAEAAMCDSSMVFEGEYSVITIDNMPETISSDEYIVDGNDRDNNSQTKTVKST